MKQLFSFGKKQTLYIYLAWTAMPALLYAGLFFLALSAQAIFHDPQSSALMMTLTTGLLGIFGMGLALMIAWIWQLGGMTNKEFVLRTLIGYAGQFVVYMMVIFGLNLLSGPLDSLRIYVEHMENFGGILLFETIILIRPVYRSLIHVFFRDTVGMK